MEIIQELKIIWEYLRKYKKTVIKLAILAMASSLITAIIPYIYGKLVDMVSLQPVELSFIFILLALWAIMSIVSAFLNRTVKQRGSFLGTDISNDLICQSSEHIIALSLKFHKEKSIGSIFSKIERSASRIRMIISVIVFWTIPQFFTVFTGIIILCFIEWRLGLGTIFLLLGYVYITLNKTALIIKSQKKLNQTFEQASGNLYDGFLNVQTIKSCSAENFQKQKIRKNYCQKLGNAFKNYYRLWNSLSFSQSVFFALGNIGIFGLALFLLLKNMITPGKLIMFLGYVNIIKNPLFNLAWQWEEFRSGMTIIKRLRELLKIKQENYNQKGF